MESATPERKISVIIPYYKGKKYIAQTIASVVNQPYKNVEIVLINDGSPDDGDEVCRALALQYPCIRYFKKDNEGIGPTRNFGVLHATGEYVQFLDQDDVWVRDFLDETTVDAIFNGGDAICFSMYNCNHDFSRGESRFAPNEVVYGGGKQAVLKAWRHHSSIFFRRQLILQHNIKAPKTRHEDEIFRNKFLYLSEKVTCIDKLFFLYRNNPNSETHGNQKPEALFGPLLTSWKSFLQWLADEHPLDEEARSTFKSIFCVFAFEGVCALCAAYRDLSKIEKLATEQLYFDDVVEYLPKLEDQNLRMQVESYMKSPRIFVAKKQAKAYMHILGRVLLRIPMIRTAYSKKRYPTDLTDMDLLY